MRTRLLPMSFLAFAITASASGQISLFSWSGQLPYDSLGVAISAARDIDQDGYPDVIIGVPHDDTAGPNMGRAWVFSGKNGMPLLQFVGSQSWAGFGSALDGAGDVNGDGYLDVIVGAPDWNKSATALGGGGVAQGLARVYSGRDGTVLYSFFGEAEYDGLGSAVAGAGDVNRDGFADLAAGAPGVPAPARSYARIFSGRDGSILHTVLADVPATRLGYAVIACGDLNGDLHPDFAASAPLDDLSAPGSGMVRVYSGKDGTPLHTWRGTRIYGNFGYSLANGQDLDGDDVNDIIIGAPFDGSFGSAYVYSGKSGVVLTTLKGNGEHGRIGRAVAGIGDVNGDLFPDFAVGSYETARVFSGKDLGVLFDLRGEAYEYFGAALSGVGDLNRDGLQDFAVGAPGESSGRGHAIVFAGTGCRAASTSSYGSGWPGTHGVPSLEVDAAPSFCKTISLSIENSRRLHTPAVLFAGVHDASLPTPWEGTLLVAPQIVVPIPLLPDSEFTIGISVPCDATLCGFSVYLQALTLDPGASKGVAFTPGLQLMVGN
jgi:hypothetical protein